MAQSKDGVFVDLYLNGEYAGNYYVTEKVEVHKNPLPITDMEKVAELTNNNEEFNVYERGRIRQRQKMCRKTLWISQAVI